MDRYSGMLVGQSTLIDIIMSSMLGSQPAGIVWYVSSDRMVCWLVSQTRLIGRCVGCSVSQVRMSGILVSHSAGIDSQVCWLVSQPK